MRTSNPVFSRWGAARDAGPADAYAHRPVGAAVGGRPTDDYATNPYTPGADTSPRTDGTAVTMDDVIVRTGTTLGTVALAAVLS